MKFAYAFLLVAVIAMSACTQAPPTTTTTQAPATTTTLGTTTTTEGAMMEHSTVTINMTAAGFVPSEVTIKTGDTVRFVGAGAVRWPASAMHPTHRVYPGSDILKCDTAEEAGIFDACGGVAEGASYEFTFNEVGKWFYHDHNDATKFGSVTVE